MKSLQLDLIHSVVEPIFDLESDDASKMSVRRTVEQALGAD